MTVPVVVRRSRIGSPAAWLRFLSPIDHARAADVCDLDGWQIGGTLEQDGTTYRVRSLDAFGGGGCNAWLELPSALVDGPAVLRIVDAYLSTHPTIRTGPAS